MSVKKVATVVVKEFINPAECVQQMVSAYTEYKIIAEQEQTKRCESKLGKKKRSPK
jgi:hypothetical protein